MPTLPNLLALTTIPPGAPIASADHRNNYAAIQDAVNQLLDLLGGGAAGQLLESFGGTGVGWGGSASLPVTALPGGPSNGQEAILVDDLDTPTYSWNMVYSSAAGKWLCVGGSPAIRKVDTNEGTTSVTYVDLATVGPSFAVPGDGDYLVGLGAMLTNGSSGSWGLVGLSIAGGAPGANPGLQGNGQGLATAYAEYELPTLVAGNNLKLMYRSTNGAFTQNFQQRFLTVMPKSILHT